MKSDYTTNSRYITHTIAFWKVGRIHFLSSGVKGLTCPAGSLYSSLPWGEHGGGLIIFLGGSVLPGPENPYPISDQNIRFTVPYFRPDSQNVYPISDPVMCGNFRNSQWIYGVQDFVAPQTMFAFVFFVINVHGNRRYSKNGIPDQTDGIYTLFQAKSIPCFRLEMLENGTLWGGTYLYGLYMGVPPPPSMGTL